MEIRKTQHACREYYNKESRTCDIKNSKITGNCFKGKHAREIVIRKLQSKLDIHERFISFKLTLTGYANAHKENF